MSDIHSNIHRLRKLNKMTLEELGAKIGTTKQTIKRYETGEIKSIPYDKIVVLANALNTTPSELMGWTDEEENLTKDTAILLAKLTKSIRLRDYVDKLVNLSEDKQETIFNYIDFISTHQGEQQ